jgi:hypothetical protein
MALKPFLRRYTDLPSLVRLMQKKCITLGDPEYWEDKNDSHFIKLYQEKLKLTSVLALCFTQETETHHHWRVFANGASGVCISFHTVKLLAAATQFRGVRALPVRYLRIKEVNKKLGAAQDLPFCKRYPFKPEGEVRLLYAKRGTKVETLDIPIPLSCIDHITLSPWLPEKLSLPTKKLLWSISDECNNLKITHSTLLRNEAWQAAGEAVPVRRRPVVK